MHPAVTRPPRYFEPPTHPIRSAGPVQRTEATGAWTHSDPQRARTRPSPQQRRRRIDPTVVLAAVMMALLFVGVLVGVATM